MLGVAAGGDGDRARSAVQRGARVIAQHSTSEKPAAARSHYKQIGVRLVGLLVQAATGLVELALRIFALTSASRRSGSSPQTISIEGSRLTPTAILVTDWSGVRTLIRLFEPPALEA
jgi:hypothetical protein